MAADNCDVRVPEAMWAAMRVAIEASMDSRSDESRLFDEEGTFVELRLLNGVVKAVLVRSDACITNERYEEWGIRAEKYGPPRFAAEDIESWGYYERVRDSSWRHPFKTVKVWKVRVWSDGRLGEAARP